MFIFIYVNINILAYTDIVLFKMGSFFSHMFLTVLYFYIEVYIGYTCVHVCVYICVCVYVCVCVCASNISTYIKTQCISIYISFSMLHFSQSTQILHYRKKCRGVTH